MSFNIKTTTEASDAAKFIASVILNKLQSGKKVLFFVTGGSSIAVGVKVSEILKEKISQSLIKNLTIMLSDERYGPTGHVDSNYFKLIEKGFNIPYAKIIPILIDEGRDITTEKFNVALDEELKKADYKIGLFGIGADGHTAGILPESVAVNSGDLASCYDTPVFSRITITPKTIERLDEAVVWAQGEDKWKMLESFNNDIDIEKQPAQILKKVPLLTIFTDM